MLCIFFFAFEDGLGLEPVVVLKVLMCKTEALTENHSNFLIKKRDEIGHILI